MCKNFVLPIGKCYEIKNKFTFSCGRSSRVGRKLAPMLEKEQKSKGKKLMLQTE